MYRSSLAHGTPPHVSPTQFDTPLPQAYDPSTEALSRGEETISESFIALCSLTLILGQALQLIYDLKQPHGRDNGDSLQAIQNYLNKWLSTHGTLFLSTENEHHREQGFQNLRISYLTLNQLLARLELDNLLRRPSADGEELHTLQTESLQAATAVVDFMTSATVDDLDAFWLPYTAYHLTATCILLLRLSLTKFHVAEETPRLCPPDDLASTALHQVSKLLDFLRSARDNHKWDLAEMCLAQCEPYYQYRTRKGPMLAPEASNPLATRRSNRKSPAVKRKTTKVTRATAARDLGTETHLPAQSNEPAVALGVGDDAKVVGGAQHIANSEELDMLDTAFYFRFPDMNLGFEEAGTNTLFPDLWAWDDFEERGAGSGAGALEQI